MPRQLAPCMAPRIFEFVATQVRKEPKRQDFQVHLTSGVAQWLACWAHNPKVRGSKPRSATFLPRRSRWDCSLTTTIPFLNQSGNHSSAHSCKFSAIHHHAHVYLPSMAACQSRCRIVVSTCMAPCQIRCSIVVSISACHAEDPGSIPDGGVDALTNIKCVAVSTSSKYLHVPDPDVLVYAYIRAGDPTVPHRVCLSSCVGACMTTLSVSPPRFFLRKQYPRGRAATPYPRLQSTPSQSTPNTLAVREPPSRHHPLPRP